MTALDGGGPAGLSRLTSGLAHALRNPLNGARLQLSALSRAHDRGAPRSEVVARIETVKSELERIGDLLDELVSLSHPRPLDLEVVDLGELIERTVTMLQPIARTRGLRLVAEVATGVPTLKIDRKCIRDAIVHLVKNGLEALQGQPGGVVAVGARVQDDTVQIHVHDDGPGLPSAIGDRAFEAFTTTKDAAVGIGLTLVERIAVAHGGAVSLHPVSPKGTRVRMTLPIV